MKIQTDLGPVVIRSNSPYYGGSKHQYAAEKAALRQHKLDGGSGTQAYAAHNCDDRDGNTYWQVTVTRPVKGQDCSVIEEQCWLWVYTDDD